VKLRRQPAGLFGVEHPEVPQHRHCRDARFAGMPVRAGLLAGVGDLMLFEEHHQRRVLPAADLAAQAIDLPVGAPERAGVALLRRCQGQQEHVDAAVGLAGAHRLGLAGVRVPGLAPGDGAAFQHSNDPPGDQLVDPLVHDCGLWLA